MAHARAGSAVPKKEITAPICTPDKYTHIRPNL